MIILITMTILRKDARLPVQLQRAMAAEAEAAREARAKVGFMGDGNMMVMVIMIVMAIITIVMVIMVVMAI